MNTGKGSDRQMLQVEHLSFDVAEEGRQSEILSDVSFSVEDGEMLVITGPNGEGNHACQSIDGDQSGKFGKYFFRRNRYYEYEY